MLCTAKMVYKNVTVHEDSTQSMVISIQVKVSNILNTFYLPTNTLYRPSTVFSWCSWNQWSNFVVVHSATRKCVCVYIVWYGWSKLVYFHSIPSINTTHRVKFWVIFVSSGIGMGKCQCYFRGMLKWIGLYYAFYRIIIKQNNRQWKR